VAGSSTWEQLRELAAFRAKHGCAVSLYLGLDPSLVATAGESGSHTRSLLARAERQLEERRATLSDDERQALARDLERIGAWFESEFSRDGVRGVAVFAAELEGLFQALLLPWPLADESAQVPGRHDQGGWSQARYERHIETIVDRHLRDVAEALDRCVRRLRGVRVVLAGPEETRAGFEGLLSSEVSASLVGWVSAEAHVDAAGLLEAAHPLLDQWRAGREEELLARWREEAARNGRAATGWEETLQAASDGRVELLLVQEGADIPAYVCPACGRAQATSGSCPLDGTTLQLADTGLDLAAHQTLTHGGTVEVIGDEHRDLEPVGGVAALLRF
jgi:hypothetical protein